MKARIDWTLLLSIAVKIRLNFGSKWYERNKKIYLEERMVKVIQR